MVHLSRFLKFKLPFLYVILLHEKFLQFDWLRAVVFQLNVKITNLLGAVVSTNNSMICVCYLA